MPQEVRSLLARLESAGYQGWAVGGCVRDTLRGAVPSDWDVTTDARPERVMALFGERVIPTGLKHGTYSDHRRPDAVQFSSSLEEDLARRDLTVNAMAMDLRGHICDPFGGQEDLSRRVLRCVGDPLRRLDEDGRADVILVGRGGGSMEDLWAFNEEVVARAVAVCRTPVVSCVGHEIDFTICDFAADVRAATPSNAAELAVGDVREWRAACDQRMIRLTRALSAAQRQRHLRLNACGQSAYLRDPARMLTERRRDRLEHLYTRLALRAEARVSEAREKLKSVSRTLEAMNPENVLARGYACVRVNDRIVTDAAELSAGQHFSVDMHAARVRATVDGVDERK